MTQMQIIQDTVTLIPQTTSPKVNFLNGLPKIYVSQEAIQTMELIVELCQQEVSWYGTVERPTPNEYIIDKIYLFEQQVTSTTTVMTGEELSKGMVEIVQTHGIEIANKIKFYGHSHVRMDINPSSQDNSQMLEWKEDCDFFIRGILNKEGKMGISLYLYNLGIALIDLPWRLMPAINAQQLKIFVQNEIAVKIKPAHEEFAKGHIYTNTYFKNLDYETKPYLQEFKESNTFKQNYEL